MIFPGPPLLALTRRLPQLWDDALFSFIPERDGFRANIFLVTCERQYSVTGKPPERLVTVTRYLGAQKTIEGTMMTERAARCAAARTAFAQFAISFAVKRLSISVE